MSDELAYSATAAVAGRLHEQAERLNASTSAIRERQRVARERQVEAAYLGVRSAEHSRVPAASDVQADQIRALGKTIHRSASPRQHAALERLAAPSTPSDPITQSLERVAAAPASYRPARQPMERVIAAPMTKGVSVQRAAPGHTCSIIDCGNYAVWTLDKIHACDLHREYALSLLERARNAVAAAGVPPIIRDAPASHACSRCGSRSAPYLDHGAYYCEGCAPWRKQ